ncbi:MAG TPA: hypothetical protein VGD74_01920 [Vulgatibacter sp.]
MTALECLQVAKSAGEDFQRVINSFVDEFRRSTPSQRREMVAAPIVEQGPLEGLVAGVVSALCRETETPTPEWVGHVGSPTPFFALPARSFGLRVRLLFESPPPFRIRNVFVPENYLDRA